MARVLYLYSQALRTDSEHARRTFQMLALLRDAGFTTDLLTLPGGAPWPDGLVKNIYVTSRIPFVSTLKPYGFGFRRAWATLVMALTAIRLTLTHHYEIVHCSDRAIRIGGLIAWLFGIKFAFEWRSSSGYDLIRWLNHRSHRFCESIGLIITDHIYTVTQLRKSGFGGKIACIHSLPLPSLNPLPLPSLNPLPLPSLNPLSSARHFHVIAFSYHSNLRDLSLLCDALPQILTTANIHFTLVGGTPLTSERLRQTLTHCYPQIITQIDLQTMPADTEAFCALLEHADLVFLPACSGAVAPPLLLDIMAVGRAILAIRCPAYEALLNHQNATLISANTLQIAESIRLHLLSPTRCIIHAAKAIDTITHERNLPEAIATLRSCYNVILLGDPA